MYRDDASALLARCNALERELSAARREIAALRRDAGLAVADEPVGAEVEIRADDVELARQMLAGLLDEPAGAGAAAAPREPEEPPAVERDAGTAELAVLRRAAVMMLGRRLGEVPAEMVARIDACPTAARLIEWIADIGAARGRRQIARILET